MYKMTKNAVKNTQELIHDLRNFSNTVVVFEKRGSKYLPVLRSVWELDENSIIAEKAFENEGVYI